MSLKAWIEQRRLEERVARQLAETEHATKNGARVLRYLRRESARNEARAKKYDARAHSAYEDANKTSDIRLKRKHAVNMAIAEDRAQMCRGHAMNMRIAAMDYETVYEEALGQLDSLKELTNGEPVAAIEAQQMAGLLERNSKLLARLKGDSDMYEVVSALKQLREKEEEQFEVYTMADQELSAISERRILDIIEPARYSPELQQLLGNLKEKETKPPARQVAAAAAGAV